MKSFNDQADNGKATEPLTIRLPSKQIAELRERAERNYRGIGQEVSRALDDSWSREAAAEAA